MDTTGETFALTATDTTLRELRETIEYVKSRADSPLRRRQVLYPSSGGGKGGEGAQGRLLSAITPCDNALTGATTFTFAKYVENTDVDPQTDPITMMEEVDSESVAVETTGVNRSPLEADIDGHVVCVKINGEWVPVLCFDQCSG
jgi:hypothetical protein